MKHRDFVLKTIRIRRRIMDQGHSKINPMQCYSRMKSMEDWLKFYPQATEEQLQKFFVRNSINILYILPGRRCVAHEKLINQFTELYEMALENQTTQKS